MNIINNYILKNKIKYLVNNEQVEFKSIFSFDIIKKIIESEKNIKYNKYIFDLFFIFYVDRTSHNIIQFDNKNIKHIIEDANILKTRIISWPKPCLFFILFNYLDIKIEKDDPILLVSKNYGLVELFKYYKFNNFDHFYYTDKHDDIINKLVEKIKSTYKFNDFKLDSEPKRKYNFMFFDLILYSKIQDDFTQTDIINIENSNLFLLKICYNYLNYLENNSNIIIYLGTSFNKDTILILQNICNCFENVINLQLESVVVRYIGTIYCKGFKGIQNKQNHITKGFYDFIKSIYLNRINSNNILIEKYKYISSLSYDNPKENKELKLLSYKNLYISQEVAKFIGFETWLVQDNLNLELSTNLQNLYSLEDQYSFEFSKIEDYDVSIKINNDTKQIPELRFLLKLHDDTLRNIDFRPAELYYNVKRHIRLYEHSLNKMVASIGIKINHKPVSRAWLKFLEILNFIDFKNFHKNNSQIKTFHTCEAPGNFIHCLEYYVKNFMKNTKLDWHSMTLKEGFGDDYGMIRNNPNRWTYGCDGTGDIIKRKNIEYYKDKCKDVDWIIGDCGISNKEKDRTLAIKLFYAQILFILHNLKKGGNFIFKIFLGIMLDNKIIIDMMYLLFLMFDKLILFKPIQNKSSQEFYFIGINYSPTLTNNDFDKLFEPLVGAEGSTLKAKLSEENNIEKYSVINKPYNKDFYYQLVKSLRLFTNLFVDTINMQLFYTDFWNNIDSNIKNKIKEMINVKNKQYIKKHLNIDV